MDGGGTRPKVEIIVPFLVLVFGDDDTSKSIPLLWGVLLREHALKLNWAEC